MGAIVIFMLAKVFGYMATASSFSGPPEQPPARIVRATFLDGSPAVDEYQEDRQTREVLRDIDNDHVDSKNSDDDDDSDIISEEEQRKLVNQQIRKTNAEYLETKAAKAKRHWEEDEPTAREIFNLKHSTRVQEDSAAAADEEEDENRATGGEENEAAEAEEATHTPQSSRTYGDGGGTVYKENAGVQLVDDTRAGPLDKLTEANMQVGKWTGKDDLIHKEFSPVRHGEERGG